LSIGVSVTLSSMTITPLKPSNGKTIHVILAD